MASQTKAELEGLLAAAATEHGFELVMLETGGTQRDPVVRVYLDHPEGVTIERIAEANRWVGELLDPRPEFERGYTLEVSSPGLDRPLVRPGDFERFVGRDVKVSVAAPIEGRRRFTGILRGLDGEDVLLEDDGAEIRLPLSAIASARLKVTVDFSKEGVTHDGL